MSGKWTSNESLVSVETEAICTEYQNHFLNPFISLNILSARMSISFHYNMLYFRLEKGRRNKLNKIMNIISVVVVLGFYVSPTAKVIRRRDLGLKSHPKDWRSPGSNSRPLD